MLPEKHKRITLLPTLLAALMLLVVVLRTTPVKAQESPSAPCGVVDAIDYPIDISDTLSNGYDDFGLLRRRFGGYHTGLDVAFNRRGDPVHAAARGLVTYSDPEGWGTEKGVVVIQHTFPDRSIAYSVYGHMEQTDTIFFPTLGTCVERGDVVGSVGWPSRGLPHLHFEWRSMLPNDGGPGYVTENPLLEGWYHPVDFTLLWRARLTSAFISDSTFDSAPSLPPVAVDSGVYVLAKSDSLEAVSSVTNILWRITTDGVVTGLAALPGNRIVAHTHNGQVQVMQGTRYAAVWSVPGPDEPFAVMTVDGAFRLIFVTPGGGLAAYDPGGGQPLWEIPATDSTAEVVSFDYGAGEVAVGVRTTSGVDWQAVDADGNVLYQAHFENTPQAVMRPDGSWIVLDGAQLYDVGNDTLGNETDGPELVATITPQPTFAARLTTDVVGNIYLFVGDHGPTLMSLSLDGTMRWQVTYPTTLEALSPLMATGSGCLLYTLDANGMLNTFSASDGSLVNQMQFYAGGNQTGSPRARILTADASDRLVVDAGFETLVTLNGATLGGDAAHCLLG
jgi:murein DD-endopeptidase MepM/ murein hydrolase activator NlpD